MNTKYAYVTGAVLISLTVLSSCDFESKAKKSKKFCEVGYTEFEAKDYTQSLADYNKAIALDSTNGNAFEGKGSDEYHLNHNEAALNDELTALRLNPELKNVRSWIGLIKSEMGDYRGSIEYYNKSIELGGDLGKDYEGRGADEYYLGDFDKAMQDETKAIQIDPEAENAYYWRAMTKENLGDYKGALEDHKKSLEKGANKGKDYEGMAADENYLEDNAKALEYINMAIASDTTLKNAYNWRGRIRQEMEDYKGSADDYTMSLKIVANKGRDYEGRAVSEYYLKDYSNALNDINMAIQSDTTLKKAQAWKEEILSSMRKG